MAIVMQASVNPEGSEAVSRRHRATVMQASVNPEGSKPLAGG
jgi:hypothetical protein